MVGRNRVKLCLMEVIKVIPICCLPRDEYMKESQNGFKKRNKIEIVFVILIKG